MPKSYPPPWTCMGIQHARNASPSFHSWERICCHAGAPGEPLLPEELRQPCSRASGLTASANAGTTSFGNFGASGGVRPFAPFGRRRKPAARKKHGLFQGPCQKARAGVLKNLALFGRSAGLIRQTPPPAPLPAPKACNAVALGIKAGKWLKNATQEGHRLSRSSR